MKPGHGGLLTNEHGNIARLEGLMIKLQQDPGKIDKYDDIIQEEGIVERVVQEPDERVFYILHKPVKREISTTTKLRIVFDVSAKPIEESPSLNECLEMGPPLQDLLWNVLMRNCIKHISMQTSNKPSFKYALALRTGMSYDFTGLRTRLIQQFGVQGWRSGERTCLPTM